MHVVQLVPLSDRRLRMTPHLEWLHPTRNATHRGILHRGPADSIQVWEAHLVGSDDYDADGIPLAPGGIVLVWLGDDPCTPSHYDTIGAAKAHAEAALAARGWTL